MSCILARTNGVACKAGWEGGSHWGTVHTKYLNVEDAKCGAVCQHSPALGCSEGKKQVAGGSPKRALLSCVISCDCIYSSVQWSLRGSSRSGVCCLCAYECRQLWIFKTAEWNSFCNNEDFISGNKEQQLNVSIQRDDTDKASLQVAKQINTWAG